MDGLKRKRRCQIECKDHIFSIENLLANSSKYDIKLQFCPKFQRQPLPPEQTYPEYNNDGKFYTSAFILGVDRRVLIKNQQQQLMDHQKQIRDSLEKHNQLVFPRPNSKHSLCSVCKEHYKNYYFHISLPEHRHKISLSPYNFHIKELCNIYIDLWRGGQERADQQAQKRAEQEELRRQRQVDLTIQQNEEDEDESLLDCQRGDQEENQDDEDQDAALNVKQNKKYNKNFKDDDTIPFTAKPSKRNAPQGRTYTSEYLRKKFTYNNNPNAAIDRTYRDREQRRYERERDKIKTQRDNPQKNKDLVKIPEKEGDAFIIMKATYSLTQIKGEFVWKKTTDRVRKQFEKNPQKFLQTNQTIEKYQNENRKYQIQYGDEYYLRRGFEQRGQLDPQFSFHPYFPPPPFHPYMPYDYKPECYRPSNYNFNEFSKGFIESKNLQEFKKPSQNQDHIQKNPFKNHQYNPYLYPPAIYNHHQSPNIQNFGQEKDMKKLTEKSHQFSVNSAWPYPHPFYLAPHFHPLPPQPQDPTTLTPKVSINNSQNNNPATNININLPLYMYPPPHSVAQGGHTYPIHSNRYTGPPIPSPYVEYPYPQLSQSGPNRQQQFTVNHFGRHQQSSNPKSSSFQPKYSNYNLNSSSKYQSCQSSAGINNFGSHSQSHLHLSSAIK